MGIETRGHAATETEPPAVDKPGDEVSVRHESVEPGLGAESAPAESADVETAPARFPPEAIHLEDAFALADGLLTSPTLGLGVEGSFPPTPTPEGAVEKRLRGR